MGSRSEQVLIALVDRLRQIPDIGVERNSALPERIPDGGLVVVRDGDPGEPEQALGGFEPVYYRHAVELEIYAGSGDQAIRDQTFDDLATAVGAALDADPTLGGLVFGWPVNMDGSEGPRCQSTKQFARNLMDVRGLSLPIAFWDERLSTAAIERLLIDQADMTRGRRDEVVDKMAAAYILQGALDSLAANR